MNYLKNIYNTIEASTVAVTEKTVYNILFYFCYFNELIKGHNKNDIHFLYENIYKNNKNNKKKINNSIENYGNVQIL